MRPGLVLDLLQRKFVKLALDLGHRLERFTIIKIPTTIKRPRRCHAK